MIPFLSFVWRKTNNQTTKQSLRDGIKEIWSPWRRKLWEQSLEEVNVCPGVVTFCGSNALLAFPAPSSGRGDTQKGAFYSPRTVLQQYLTEERGGEGGGKEKRSAEF